MTMRLLFDVVVVRLEKGQRERMKGNAGAVVEVDPRQMEEEILSFFDFF